MDNVTQSLYNIFSIYIKNLVANFMQIGNSSNNLLIQNGLTHGHLLKYIGINNA
jgi:hypothetical protein